MTKPNQTEWDRGWHARDKQVESMEARIVSLRDELEGTGENTADPVIGLGLRAALELARENEALLRHQIATERAKRIVAEQHRTLELMSRGSAAVELENRLREQLAEAQLKIEDLEDQLQVAKGCYGESDR